MTLTNNYTAPDWKCDARIGGDGNLICIRKDAHHLGHIYRSTHHEEHHNAELALSRP